MDLLNEIIECSDDELDEIIENTVMEMNKNTKRIDKLGFLDSFNSVNVYKGFIPFDTRIKYSNYSMEDYSMNTTDFFFEFAKYVKKNKINNKSLLVRSIEPFINNYFGYPSKRISREDIFQDKAWNSTNTDEEYFKALENNTIGDLKGTGSAECTERAALAQQLLSLFGFETYYLIGKVKHNDKEEYHAFNAVKRKNDYAILDYSIPSPIYDDNDEIVGYVPFLGILSNKDFESFINNNDIKEFNDMYYVRDKQVNLYDTREYSVEESKKIKLGQY